MTFMTVEAFLDTNILAYAVSGAPEDAAKRKVAEKLIESVDFGISGQVLQEFYNTVTRKFSVPLTHDEAIDWLLMFEELPVVPVDASLVYHGAETAQRYKLSYWDGAIVAAAQRLQTQTLFTEDLNHGQSYGSVRAVNPFHPN